MGEGELEDRAKVIFAELEKKKKRERKEIFHHNCDECETFHYGTAHWPLPVHTTFTVSV